MRALLQNLEVKFAGAGDAGAHEEIIELIVGCPAALVVAGTPGPATVEIVQLDSKGNEIDIVNRFDGSPADFTDPIPVEFNALCPRLAVRATAADATTDLVVTLARLGK
jgi:hypothetical protein